MIVIVPSFLICHLYIVRQSVAISGALLYFQMTLSVHTYKKNSGTTMNRQLYRQCTSVPSLNYSVQCTSVQSLNYSAVCTLCRQQWIAWEPEQGFCQRQGLVDCCMILHSSINTLYVRYKYEKLNVCISFYFSWFGALPPYFDSILPSPLFSNMGTAMLSN